MNRIKYNKESSGGTRKLKERASRRSMSKSMELLVVQLLIVGKNSSEKIEMKNVSCFFSSVMLYG